MGGAGSGPHHLPPELRADQRKHRATSSAAAVFGPKGEPPVPEIIADNELRQAHWRYVCESLESMGILAETDEGIITAYVVARTDMETAVKLQDRFEAGETIEMLKDGDVAFAGLKDLSMKLRSARQDVARFAAMLGLTPTSRSNIPKPPPGPSGESRYNI